MRFNIKKRKKKSKTLTGIKSPNVGDKKHLTRFAYLPVRINDNVVVWLEKYIIVYKYEEFLKKISKHVAPMIRKTIFVKHYDWKIKEKLLNTYLWDKINK